MCAIYEVIFSCVEPPRRYFLSFFFVICLHVCRYTHSISTFIIVFYNLNANPHRRFWSIMHLSRIWCRFMCGIFIERICHLFLPLKLQPMKLVNAVCISISQKVITDTGRSNIFSLSIIACFFSRSMFDLVITLEGCAK